VRRLPETPEEQADEARRAYEAGASQIHVHVRDPQDWSQCSGNPEHYGLVNRMIREQCPDVIINNSTGGGPTLTTEERYSPLFADPAPDVATLNLGPFVSRFTMPERPDHLPHPRGPIDYDMCSGTTYGETDDYGVEIASQPCHVHDYHATILHLMGIDHTKLTYRYAGRNFRLTDVSGNVLQEVLA